MARKPSVLDIQRQLGAVLVRNEHARSVTPSGADPLIVEVTLRYRGWRGVLARWLKPARTRRYELAGLGRELYLSIDGKATFEELIDAFAARHQLSFLEARGLLAQYCRTLLGRGLVAVVVRQPGPETAAGAAANDAPAKTH